MTEEVRQKKIKIELFKEQETYTIYNGSMLDMLQVIEPNSIDAIVTDPPYELNFMNKGWDNCGISFNPDTWKKCYEVLKPGGYLLAFGGSRTFHRIACAIEDAGFEIRDTIMWLYGSGFPKSMNIGLAIDKKKDIKSEIIASYERYNEPSGIVNIGQGERKKVIHKVKKASNEWQGWGTALKPAYEPIIVARKPLSGTVVDNVLTYGVGGINIDDCRVGTEERFNSPATPSKGTFNASFDNDYKGNTVVGRFPANIIHDDSFQIDEETQANRYFYSAKASKKDRDEGLEFAGFEEQKTTDGNIKSNEETARIFGANSALRKNIHPTVKPCELMQYLVRLVSPKGATILDPFMGSGSTGKAVMFENRERNANYKFIGIDLEENYCQIANARIDYALNKYEYDVIKEQQQAKQRGQTSIFEFLEG